MVLAAVVLSMYSYIILLYYYVCVYRKSKLYKLNQGALNKASDRYFDGMQTVELWNKPREVTMPYNKLYRYVTTPLCNAAAVIQICVPTIPINNHKPL